MITVLKLNQKTGWRKQYGYSYANSDVIYSIIKRSSENDTDHTFMVTEYRSDGSLHKRYSFYRGDVSYPNNNYGLHY